MPNISTSRDPGNCGVCFLVCNANEVNTALRQKNPDKNKKKKTTSKTNKTRKRLNTKKTREEKN